MRTILTVALLTLCFCVRMNGQLTVTNASGSMPTAYTTSAPNDSVFFICAGETATLLATPPGGTPGWDFIWQRYIASTGAWNPLTSVFGVPSSTQAGMNPGGYRVTIVDGTGTVVGTYIVWVSRINSSPSVNINPITPGCTSTNLTATVLNGAVTPYYNPPSSGPDPSASMIIDANTEITVCFTATHTFVSDLAFHLVGPASCGSPNIILANNPGTNCNAGDNITNLCFSTESTTNFNVCTALVPLTGTFGTFGAGSTAINWSSLYGCDANALGWSIQLWDCVGGDEGTLTGASVSFTGTTVGGDFTTLTYASPGGFSSPIAITSCSSALAANYTISGPPVPPPIYYTFGYEWTADPPFPIPNSTTSLNIALSPSPTVDTQFTLTLTGNNPGALCGGSTTDTELFDYLTAAPAVIVPVDDSYCLLDPPFNLQADIAGGVWAGQGITNASAGTFSPLAAGEGIWTISYTPPGGCSGSTAINIGVIDQEAAVITGPASVCESLDPFNFTASIPGGTWSGYGITNTSLGTFDPNLVVDSTVTINYAGSGTCPVIGSTEITVQPLGVLSIVAPESVCESDVLYDLSSNVAGGTWSGTGIINTTNGIFDPGVAGPGNWTISYSYSNICTDSTSVIINVVDSMLTLTPVPPVCASDAPFLLQASMPGGSWSGPGITNATTGLFDPATVGTAGIYTVYYFVNAACMAYDSLDISVSGVPSVSITDMSALCIDHANIFFNASEPGGNWTGSGIVGTTTGEFDPSLTAGGPIVITYTIPGVCDATDISTIQVNPLPPVSAGADLSMCEDDNVVLNGSGATTFGWSPAAGLSSTGSATPTAHPANTTTYTLTGISDAGCVATDQVTVTVHDNPVVTTNGPLTICRGDEIQLIANGINNYQWTGSNMSSHTVYNPLVSPANTEVYTVSGTDAFGCPGSASVTVNVTVADATFIASSEEGLAPLHVVFTNMGDGDFFAWDFGNGQTTTNSLTSIAPSTTYTEGGLYTITLSSTLDGCTVEYIQTVFVYEDSQLILVPNVVTLNGDGKNDTWTILSQNMRNFEAQVFDRWGKNVGSITKPSGNWDPREYGTGTYYFILKAEGYDGLKFDRSGFITVLEK